MSDEPFPIKPVRIEPRGEFPTHSHEPLRRLLSADEARARARQRLEDWRAEHGDEL